MSMFPGSNAHVYRNEAGEVLGWDYPSEPECDPDDYLPDYDEEDDEMDEQTRADCEDAQRILEQTWPDLDGRCEDLIREAFSVLNEAPGRRQKYADVQALLAQAIRRLRES